MAAVEQQLALVRDPVDEHLDLLAAHRREFLLANARLQLHELGRALVGWVNLLHPRMIVIGGGNTACDVAQTAHRLGARVNLVYRRTEKEMPAFAEEVEQLRKEKIQLDFLASPEKIKNSDEGKLKVTFGRMKLGEPDEMGRARPVPIAGSSFDLTVDIVYAAIGEDADLSFFPEVSWESGGFDFSKADKRIREKLFVGGDILPNPRTVPHAVASGRLGAERISAFLRGETMTQPETIVEVASYEDVNYHYFNRINVAAHMSNLSSNGSIESPAKAAEEAARCFSCGVCTECDNCYNYCPDLAVIKTSAGYQVNFDYCKGCGICAQECPGGALRMERGK